LQKSTRKRGLLLETRQRFKLSSSRKPESIEVPPTGNDSVFTASFSVDKYLTEKVKRSVTRKNCTKSNEYGQYRVDTVTSGKEKARERSEAGTWVGGRAQWVKRAQRVERASERIDIAVWWRSTVAGAVRVETSRIGGDRR